MVQCIGWDVLINCVGCGARQQPSLVLLLNCVGMLLSAGSVRSRVYWSAGSCALCAEGPQLVTAYCEGLFLCCCCALYAEVPQLVTAYCGGLFLCCWCALRAEGPQLVTAYFEGLLLCCWAEEVSHDVSVNEARLHKIGIVWLFACLCAGQV